MLSVAEIAQAIAQLSDQEFVELEVWYDAERNRKWDRQMKENAQSGMLRDAEERLNAENQGQPLDDFLDVPRSR